jgi:hypothetical protein
MLARAKARYRNEIAAGGADLSLATHDVVRRETAYGCPPSHRSREGQTSDDDRSRQQPGSGILAAARERCARLIPAGCRTWSWRESAAETLVATHGGVEIRRLPSGCVARTCVKGELAQARETALRRLGRYVDGDNAAAARLVAERPVTQQRLESRRWLISVRLPTIEDASGAPAPRGPKVKVVRNEPELLAVVRMGGWPKENSVTRGDTRILAAIANTKWVAIGKPTLRLHRRAPIGWLIGGFDIAVPVERRW